MKKLVTLDQLNAQAALELPDREMLLVTVVVNNVLNNLSIDVDVRNVNVGVQVCAVVPTAAIALPRPRSPSVP